MARVWRSTILPSFFGFAAVVAGFCMKAYAPSFIHEPLGVVLGTFLSLIAGAGSSSLALLNGLTARREKRRTDAYSALLAALAKIADKTGVPAKDIGLNAYILVRKWNTTQWQARIARVRLADYPPPSTIQWTKGKGLVGQCWAQGHIVLKLKPREAQNYTEQQWNRRSAEKRQGLTFDEWKTTRRYAYICAYPIQTEHDNDPKYRGCVTLDCTKDEHVAKLETTEVDELLASAANVIRKALST